jgi:hypothetical protein
MPICSDPALDVATALGSGGGISAAAGSAKPATLSAAISAKIHLLMNPYYMN